MTSPTVYFARAGDDGPIKIGYTASSPVERIAALQTGCPWRISLIGAIEGGTKEEAWLHRRFAALKIEGEWFRPTPEIEKAILAPGFTWPNILETGDRRPQTKLGTWLKANGIARSEFALALGCSHVAVTRYVLGDRFPERDILIAIYVATNGEITPNDFVDLPDLSSRLQCVA